MLSETIDSVLCFDSRCFADSRGVFLKVFDAALPQLSGFCPQQVNHVQSPARYTLRGLHYQTSEHAEAKIFRAIRGAIQLAWVDLRTSSTKGRPSSGTIILDRPETSVLVPRGFATGYLTLEPDSEVLYLSDNAYAPKYEQGLRWDDPQLDLNWLHQYPTISEKDTAWPLLAPSC